MGRTSFAQRPLVLSYSGCSTCKKAIAWLRANGIDADIRPIVDEPPTLAELARWIPKSGVGIRKWLNTSGQSYRAIGKERASAATDDDLAVWLAKDGKLCKRPVLVTADAVLVGFKEDAYRAVFRGV